MAYNYAVALEVKAGVTGAQMVDDLSDKLKKLAATADISAGQIKQAYRQLPAQFTDIAVSLAGGQSPFMVLLQQGGQIRDQFGSIGTALRALTTMITPAGLALTALAVSIGAVGAAYYQGSEEAIKFAKSVALTGGAAGLTFGLFNDAAKRLADSAEIGVGSAKELVSALVGAGISGAVGLEPMARAMARIQKLSGASTDDIVKDFASMSRGVAAWAEKSNRQYNFLTAAQYEQIRALEKQGEVEKAMLLTNTLIDKAFSERIVQVHWLEQGYNDLGKALSNLWDDFKGLFRAETNSSLLAEAEDTLAALEAKLEARKRGIYSRGGIAENNKEIEQAKAEVARRKAAVEDETDHAIAEGKRRSDERAKIAKLAAAEAESEASLKRLSQINKNASEATIRGFQEQSQKLVLARAADIITEKEFQTQKAVIDTQILEAKIALLDKEIGVERERKVFGAAQIEQETKILAMLGQRRELLSQIRGIPIQAEIATAKDETAERKRIDAQAKADAKARDERNRTEINTIEKMRVDREAEIDQLRLQGQAINMTSHEFEVLTAARQAELEIGRAVVTMLPENAAAYRAVAEAAAKTSAAMREANYQQSRTFEYGAKQAFKNYLEDVNNVAKSTEQLFTDAFKGMEDAMVNFAMTGKLSFRDLATSIIEDMIRITIQQSIMGPLMGVLGGFLPGASTAAAGTSFSGSANIANFAANGMAFDGGVVNSPTMFKFANGGTLRNGLMGEAGPEAIMPLARTSSGKLGVMSTVGSGGGGDTSVVVNVNVESGSEQVSSNQGASALGKVIAGAVRQELINQKRPGGMLAA